MGDKRSRGLASFDAAKRREIAGKGGQTAQAKGTAHKFTSAEARAAGRKGGAALSKNRAHMAKIGRKGGLRGRKRQPDSSS
jgi:general stress protein YciG